MFYEKTNIKFGYFFLICYRHHVYLPTQEKNDKVLNRFGDALCKK